LTTINLLCIIARMGPTAYLTPMDKNFADVNIEDIKKKVVKVKHYPDEPLLSLTVIKLKDGSVGRSQLFTCRLRRHYVYPVPFSLGMFHRRHPTFATVSSKIIKGKPISSDKIDKVFIPSLSELSDEIKERLKSVDEKIYTKREYFPDELLDDIKKKAKLENEKYNISNNQIMNALILKNYYKQMLPGADKIRLRTPINLRDVHPDIDSMVSWQCVF